MTESTAPFRNASRHRLLTTLGIAALVCGLGSCAAAPVTRMESHDDAPRGHGRAVGTMRAEPTPGAPVTKATSASLGVDGTLPSRVTVFDERYAGVAKLAPALLHALQAAAASAAGDGVTIYVNSGWRSRPHQRQLLDPAVATYGSREEAARWVATPDTSLHVSGRAADIGRSEAVAWLADHGASFGLCQVYANEPWHFELRSDAASDGCPRPYADPTEDPRLTR